MGWPGRSRRIGAARVYMARVRVEADQGNFDQLQVVSVAY